ncbi:hypothetical protein M569_08305, partial [Genlisea aurea]
DQGNVGDPQLPAIALGSGELLDEIITRSRGEIRRSRSPRPSSTTTPSPRQEMRAMYSPRLDEIRSERSPRFGRFGLQTPSPRSPLGGGETSRGPSDR